MNEKDEAKISSKQNAIVEGILLLLSLTVSSVVVLLIISKLIFISSDLIAIFLGLICFLLLISTSYIFIVMRLNCSPSQV